MFLSVVLFLSFLYSSLSVSSAGSSDVQYAHLVAAIGISDMQYGQIFVAGAAGASSSFLSSFSVLEARLFITFTKQKITSAIRRKLITAVIKLPYLIVSFSPDPIRITQLEKLTPPVRRLITGMIISFTREFSSLVPFSLLRHIRILYYIPNRISTIIPHTILIP